MIVNNEEALKRLNSPMNLINRMRKADNNVRKDAMSLFGLQRKEQIQHAPLAQDRAADEINLKVEQGSAVQGASIFNPFEKNLNGPQSMVEALTAPERTSLNTDSDTTKLSDILDNHDSQIKLGLAHDRALQLLNDSVNMLATKLDDIKADKLPAVVSAASKTVESIRRERIEAAKHGEERAVHYHFYTPQQKKVSDYEIIDVA